MIIEARQDVVSLSGSLQTNLWPAIQAAAHLALRSYPNGILIDASQITTCSEDGALTFLDAMQYIQMHRARILLCHPPPAVLEKLKQIPEVRSQLPIAQSCEEGRASLKLASDARRRARDERMGVGGGPIRPRVVAVPLYEGCTAIEATIGMALLTGSLEPSGKWDASDDRKRIAPVIRLVYALEVPRAMPLNAPMTEEEEYAGKLIDKAVHVCQTAGVECRSIVARCRDIGDEVASQAADIGAEIIIIPLPAPNAPDRERLELIAETILQRARCEVLVKNWAC
jgi:anti-anti-sigma regulatory factor/nucleotide-binding universal stress UspA family protein